MDNRRKLIAERATQTNSMYYLSERYSCLTDLELFPFYDPSGTGVDGRGIVVAAPNCHVAHTVIHQGDDDGISLHNDFHGTTLYNVQNVVDDFSRGWKGFLLGSNYTEYWPAYGADAGFAATLTRCQINGLRAAGGIYNLIDCDVWIGQIAGLDLMDCLLNAVNVRFWDREKPAAWPYWWPVKSKMIPVRVAGVDRIAGKQIARTNKTELFFSNCTWNGSPATGPQLCRRLDGTAAPASIFRREFITKCVA